MLYKTLRLGQLEQSALETLTSENNPWNKDAEGRARMTLACRDTDYIPRVEDAGKTKTVGSDKVQVMHNGLLVKKDGYQGQWQSKVIESLNGNHEPQEEKVFYEVLKRVRRDGVMIELGSWWSYYSMWFIKETNGRAICTEPDPVNLKLGTANAVLNGIKVGSQISFYAAASGLKDKQKIKFVTEAGTTIAVPVRTVDSIVTDEKIDKIDILHMDIQGFETQALKSASKTIKSGKVRFLFVSTHHYVISGDPLTHQKCLDFIESNGGTIISKHTILESCSGDGLIVASFSDADKDFRVETSHQHTDDSLFRPAEIDTGILWDSHEKLIALGKKKTDEVKTKTDEIIRLQAKNNSLQDKLDSLQNRNLSQRTRDLVEYTMHKINDRLRG